MVDLDGKEFKIRILPDCGAGASIFPRSALPAGGRWSRNSVPKIRINGVGKQSCSASEEITFIIRPLKEVAARQKTVTEIVIKALLLEGHFKRELPKYELPAAMVDALSEHNISDTDVLKPGTEPLIFNLLVGMNVLNSFNRKNHVKFTNNLRLKRCAFGDALSGPIEEFIEQDTICRCAAQHFRSTRKQSKRCKCENTRPKEVVYYTAPLFNVDDETEASPSEQKVHSCCIAGTAQARAEDLLEATKNVFNTKLANQGKDIPSIFIENSTAYTDHLLSESLRRYCSLMEDEMKGGEVTPDEHNQNVHDKFLEEIIRIPDPTADIPDRKRYEIKLPWIEDNIKMMSKNKKIAKDRLNMLLQKFEKNAFLEEVYSKQFDDWFRDDFIEEVPMSTLDELDAANEPYCVLPHHVVVKPESKTTPYRVVLDGSAKEKGKNSLNDSLETGPNLLPSLKAISLRFRFGEVYYMSDISRAFFQLKLCGRDAARLYLFWVKKDNEGRIVRDDKGHPVIILIRFKRMPWGLNCSPFCLIATINHHLNAFTKNATEIFPNAEHLFSDARFAEYLKNETYMDDLIQTEDDRVRLIELAEFAKRALALGCFNLVKIESNDPEIHQRYNPDADMEIFELPEHKVLGTLYNPKMDTLTVCCKKLQKIPETQVYNRRIALQVQGMFFDPLGLAGPIHLHVRRLVQSSSYKMKTWDAAFSAEDQKRWRAMTKSLQEFTGFSVKRLTAPVDGDYKTHIFCDASIAGYGAVAYITHNDESTLLSSVVRIIPEKMTNVSIPRLELLSAVVASKLWQEIKRALRKPPKEVTFWTDSMTSLSWIRGDPNAYKAFVSNRIRQIQTLTSPEGFWKFCPGIENPADILSRGCEPHELIDNSMWLHGPAWITNKSRWPKNATFAEIDERLAQIEDDLEKEKRSQTVLFSRTVLTESILDRILKPMMINQHTLEVLAKLFIQQARWKVKATGHAPVDPDIAEALSYTMWIPTKQEAKTSYWHDRYKHKAEMNDYVNSDWIQSNSSGPPQLTNKVRMQYFEDKGLVKNANCYEKEELAAAERYLLKITQRHHAPDLYEALHSRDLSRLGDKDKHLVHQLDLRMSDRGLIYTHGRIMTDSDSQKSLFKPLIWVPAGGRVAYAIMNQYHRHSCAGQAYTLALTRRRFWIMSPSRVFQMVRDTCTKCKMDKLQMFGTPDQGALPNSRRTITRAYEVVGIDFAGPLFRTTFKLPEYEPPAKKRKMADGKMKSSVIDDDDDIPDHQVIPDPLPDATATGRRKSQKSIQKLSYFIMIVTCANTRNIELYLMRDLKTQTVAMVWEQFCGRWGCPKKVYSDNGSNIRKLEGQIRLITEKVIKSKTPWVEWRFIPVETPWWGGFYERVVGMVKNVLHKTCRTMTVPSELHANHLVQMSAHILNNRPLWGLNMDPTNVDLIKPNSFTRVKVTDSTVSGHGDPEGRIPNMLLKRFYETQQRRIALIWREFHLGYMSELRKFAAKKKHKFTLSNLKVGDLVLYETPNVIRNFWPIARIREIIKSRFGAPKAVRLDKYVPTEINQALRLFHYKRRRLNRVEKAHVTGYFKPMPNPYSITRLAPYEFWESEVNPTTIVGEEEDRLPARVLYTNPVTGKKVLRKPTIDRYRLQDEDCEMSLLPQQCRGGTVHITLESSKPNEPKRLEEFKVNDSFDLQPKVRGDPETLVSKRYDDLCAFCVSTHYDVTKVRFEPDIRMDSLSLNDA